MVFKKTIFFDDALTEKHKYTEWAKCERGKGM
jgi:hypothetical protein